MPKIELVFQTVTGQIFYHEYTWVYGQSVAQFLEQTQVLQQYPELKGRALGIYGRLVEADTLVQPGDRLEIYAPLKIDPKAQRRAKAKKKPGS